MKRLHLIANICLAISLLGLFVTWKLYQPLIDKALVPYIIFWTLGVLAILIGIYNQFFYKPKKPLKSIKGLAFILFIVGFSYAIFHIQKLLFNYH